MKFTDHAATRSQQRGIPPLMVDLLLKFGCREHDHAGAEVCFFDRRSKKRLESYVGSLAGKLSEHLDSYIVVAGDLVVTVGHRYKKIKKS